ncbi:hypothetical protein SAMN05216338_1006198 [Bradyrhizobium sp. Rc2d]|uniref:hypothetical protein n=1 Tax=Bradyrhizobium sp. Rc2d TaxID=1855321 RepID=UPI000885FA3D|nr:hypothetical protein [Bradyrhizobium sp. Rc2d]SDH21424.1 hypothetical protein SAMN05216338_1006198 [Bradyrhizobium sp. Rc2d]
MQKPDEPTLYDLFDETSFRYWELQLQEGREPSLKQLVALIEANADQAFRSSLRPVLIKGLRGELKVKRGRPARDSHQQTRLWLAKCDYHGSLAEQREAREARPGVNHKPASKGGVHIPTHERVAEEVLRRWRLPMTVRSFLNEIASQK